MNVIPVTLSITEPHPFLLPSGARDQKCTLRVQR